MTWTSPFTAVTGAVITAAGWNASARDNLNHLRALLPDPGATDYLLQASSTSAAAFVSKSSALAAYALLAGAAFSGAITFPTGTGISFGQSGTPSQIADAAGFGFIGSKNDIFRIYNAALSQIMLAISPTVVAVLGELQAATAAIAGAATVGGTLSITGTTTAAALNTSGTITAPNIAASGISQGNTLVSIVATGTAPLTVSSTTEVANLNASRVAGKIPTATPGAAALPLADGSSTLDSWITAAKLVPSGLIAAFATAAAIASGWARYTALDGRIPVGAGTTFSVTYTEATDYGSAWSHTPLGTIAVTIGAPSATHNVDDDAGGDPHATSDHTHSIASQTFTGSATSWVIPSRAVVWAQKS